MNVLVLFGLLFTGLGIYLLFYVRRIDNSWQIVKGKIVDHTGWMLRKPNLFLDPNKHAVIEYQVNGKTYQLANPMSFNQLISFPPPFFARDLGGEEPIGKELNIAYDPANPNKAKVADPKTQDALLVMGLFVLLIGIVSFISAFKGS